MNKAIDHTALLPGNFISPGAVHGPQIQITDPLDAERRRPTEGQGVAAHTSSPSAVRPLRRWSVAELLAGALARPPAGRVACRGLGNATGGI